MRGVVYSPDRLGYPLHRISEDGDFILSFGSTSPDYQEDRQYRSIRRAAYARDHTVWTVELHRYRLEQWDAMSGELLRRLERHGPWVPDMERPFALNLDAAEAPNGGIRAMFVDSAGVAWVVLSVPEDDWEDGVGPLETPQGRRRGVVDADEVWDTVVEAIKLDSGSAVGRVRMDEVLSDFVRTAGGRPMPILYRETSLGLPTLTVLALHLVKT